MNILDRLLGTLPQKSRKERRAQYIPVKPRTQRSTVSRKVWVMLSADGHEVRTPWAAKEHARRRAATRVAKQARKVNRRYRTTGGLR